MVGKTNKKKGKKKKKKKKTKFVLSINVVSPQTQRVWVATE